MSRTVKMLAVGISLLVVVGAAAFFLLPGVLRANIPPIILEKPGMGRTAPQGTSQPQVNSFLFNGQTRPNILLVVFDAMRQDGFSLYGNPRKTTPKIDEFAKSSTVFTNAYSTSCWTVPGHASLFSGLYPISHGATQEHVYLDNDVRTIAEILQREGYHTVGFCNNPFIGQETNFARGFKEYYEMWRFNPNPIKAVGGFTNAEIKAWFQRGGSGGLPFFMFINYTDVHRPLWPPAGYKELFLERPMAPEYDTFINQNYNIFYSGKAHYVEEDFKAMRSLYDSETRYLDDLFADLLVVLKATGLYDKTVIILTSDHGENFGEHGHIIHMFSLYDTTQRIPLVIHYSPLFDDGAVDTRKIQLVDLFPTILHAAHVDPKRYPSSGLDLLNPKEKFAERPIFAEYYYPEQVLSVFSEEERSVPSLNKYKRRICSYELGGYKLIWGSDGVHELYHIEKDPHETTNLVTQNPKEVEFLTNKMQELKKQLPVSPSISSRIEPHFDKESREALKSLGYIK